MSYTTSCHVHFSSQAPRKDVVDAVEKKDPAAVADKLDKGYHSESVSLRPASTLTCSNKSHKPHGPVTWHVGQVAAQSAGAVCLQPRDNTVYPCSAHSHPGSVQSVATSSSETMVVAKNATASAVAASIAEVCSGDVKAASKALAKAIATASAQAWSKSQATVTVKGTGSGCAEASASATAGTVDSKVVMPQSQPLA